MQKRKNINLSSWEEGILVGGIGAWSWENGRRKLAWADRKKGKAGGEEKTNCCRGGTRRNTFP